MEELNSIPDAAATTQAEIDELLGNYKAPLKVDPVKVETPAPETTPPPPPPVPGQPSAPPPPPPPVTNPADPGAPYGRFQNGKPRKKPIGHRGPLPPPPTPPPGTPVEIKGSVIDGGLFILMVDTLMPLLISMINNKVSDRKINPDKLQMTASQRKDLTPITDALMREIQLTGSPKWIFFLTLFGIYGLNLMAAHMAADMRKPKPTIPPQPTPVK